MRAPITARFVLRRLLAPMTKPVSRHQKFAVLLAALPAITGTLYFIVYHDFAPNPELYWPSVIVTAVLTGVVFAIFYSKFKSGSWVLAKRPESRKEKWVLWLLPLVFYLYALLHVYIVIPRIYTSLFGTEMVISEAIKARETEYGRYRTCDYQIKTENHQAFGLHLCISREQYNSMPDRGGIAILRIIKSPAGTLIESVSLPRRY
ncbi:hypothetical protein Pstr01_13750 [Pseudomonas straminea]|nr:hypothetical protein Pstr01_13750 [Pseudomonas straminea]